MRGVKSMFLVRVIQAAVLAGRHRRASRWWSLVWDVLVRPVVRWLDCVAPGKPAPRQGE